MTKRKKDIKKNFVPRKSAINIMTLTKTNRTPKVKNNFWGAGYLGGLGSGI